MRAEQFLEINFDELQSQMIDLLHEIQNEQMFLKLEAESNKCRMVFYEKSRLKSLIFLVIDLTLTDQREIIEEMTKSIATLKEENRNCNYRLSAIRNQLQEKETLLGATVSTSKIFENRVKKDMQMLENVFCTTLHKLERTIGEKLNRLSLKQVKLLGDVESVKNDNRLKCESSVRLVNSLHSLRLENERHLKMVDELKLEVNHLNILRRNCEDKCATLQRSLESKNHDMQDCKGQISELKKDLQDATMIIAQKSKTHDEIAKDLVQANSMLVNFNNQCDTLSKELDESREVIQLKDRSIKEINIKAHRMQEEFDVYRTKYNVEEFAKLQQELCLAKQKVNDLEKHNKETIKLNGLLTRKLSSGDVSQPARNAWLPPSQRSNY